MCRFLMGLQGYKVPLPQIRRQKICGGFMTGRICTASLPRAKTASLFYKTRSKTPRKTFPFAKFTTTFYLRAVVPRHVNAPFYIQQIFVPTGKPRPTEPSSRAIFGSEIPSMAPTRSIASPSVKLETSRSFTNFFLSQFFAPSGRFSNIVRRYFHLTD